MEKLFIRLFIYISHVHVFIVRIESFSTEKIFEKKKKEKKNYSK